MKESNFYFLSFWGMFDELEIFHLLAFLVFDGTMGGKWGKLLNSQQLIKE